TAAAGLLGLPSGTVTIGPPPGLHSTVLPTAGARCKFADYPVKRSANKGVRAAVSLKPAGAAWPTSGTMALRSLSAKLGQAAEDVRPLKSCGTAVRLADTEHSVPASLDAPLGQGGVAACPCPLVTLGNRSSRIPVVVGTVRGIPVFIGTIRGIPAGRHDLIRRWPSIGHAAAASPRSPHHQPQQHANDPHNHQDHADRVNSDAVRGRGRDPEPEDGSHRDQNKASADCHHSPPMGAFSPLLCPECKTANRPGACTLAAEAPDDRSGPVGVRMWT